jgi:hypothetical protein
MPKEPFSSGDSDAVSVSGPAFYARTGAVPVSLKRARQSYRPAHARGTDATEAQRRVIVFLFFWKALYCIFGGVRSVRLGLIRVVPILWEVRNDHWSPFYATECTSTQEPR